MKDKNRDVMLFMDSNIKLKQEIHSMFKYFINFVSNFL